MRGRVPPGLALAESSKTYYVKLPTSLARAACLACKHLDVRAKYIGELEQLLSPRKSVIRRCWLAADVERYLAWLRQRGFGEHLIRDRVPPLVRFAKFTCERGLRSAEQASDDVDALVTREGLRCYACTRDARRERR
jgi:hypothetical protein